MKNFMGRTPGRKQLNRQFIFYTIALTLVALMLMALKKYFAAP